MLKEIAGHITAPINRFFVVSVGLLAFVAARVIRAGAEYPLLLLGALVAAAIGALLMVGMDARRSGREISTTIAYTLAGGALVAAIVFAVTWLLVAPAA